MSRAVTPTLRLGCTYTAAATSAGRTVRRQVFTSSTASRALPQEQQRAGRGSSNFGSGRCRVFASMVAASDEVTRKVTTETNQKAAAALGEPAVVWKHFAALASIPRPSKKEEQVLDWIKSWASQRGLAFVQDACGNLVVKRDGQNGGENAPTVILQGHLDMVCEKNASTEFDFDKDPIQLDPRGDWLHANGTTLGADNGLGVAAILAVLENETAPLPPIEALFTVDEETGLTGAQQLDGSILSGKTLLNLDTEDFGALFVGCAGGGNSTMTIDGLTREMTAATNLMQLEVNGFVGGHSGINIHEGRGNAVQVIALVLSRLLKDCKGARLVSFEGGDKHNAIPRESRAVVAVSEAELEVAKAVIKECEANTKTEYGLIDKDIAMTLSPISVDGEVFALEPASSNRLLSTYLALPHGPLKFSAAVQGLVETSNNVAQAKLQADATESKVVLSTRSSIASALEGARDKLEAIALISGAKYERGPAYPGWAPDMKSPVLALAKTALSKYTDGKEPEVLAIHAGLECGLIGERIPGADMVSFGPTIVGAHSPDEAVKIDTVPPFFSTVMDTLEALAAKA